METARAVAMVGVQVGVPLGLATFLAWRGLKKKSLSRSGAQAAFMVGSLSLGCLPRAGVALLAFYVTGSKLTKVAAKEKDALDADYGESSERNAEQVLSCSLLGTALAIGHFVMLGGKDGAVFPIVGGPSLALHRAIMLGIASHYATCAADTWASELGVLSKAWPFLITEPSRRVPPGTNGGVSGTGLFASVGGGACIGLALWISGWFIQRQHFMIDWQLVPISMTFGLCGSLLDSLLGAMFQETLYDSKLQKIVRGPGENVKRICGKAILNNQQVNQVSVAAMTGLGMLLGYISVC